MNEATRLPADVIAAIQAGRKIEAIKLLRQRQGCDLVQAKAAVDAYMEAHRSPGAARRRGGSGFGSLLFALAVAAVAYFLYAALVAGR